MTTLSRQLGRRINWSGTAVIVVAIVSWQALAGPGPLGSIQSLPTPTEVIGGFEAGLGVGKLLVDTGYTLFVVLVSSMIAITAGLLLGLLLGLSSRFEALTGSSFDVLRTIPLVALMPVALLIWGAEARTEIIVSSVAATWPMLVNTAGGVASVHPRLHEVGRMFKFSRSRTVCRVVLPAALPQVLVGARLAIVTALVAAIVAEMIVSPSGLGWALIEAQHALQPGRMWAVLVTCGVVGVALNIVLTAAVERFGGSSMRRTR